METVCKLNKCAGCMACIDICPRNCITIIDDIEFINARINEIECIRCGQCHRVCQKNHPAALKKPIMWYQGWAIKDIRKKSSSGGFSSAIEKAFIIKGGVVASCKLSKGDFRFILAKTVEDLEGFSGSKYVKSNPIGIYRAVKNELQNNRKVLFLGLPCQVSSMRNYVGKELEKKLYTIDLICHGTPSIKILKMALEEYGFNLYDSINILFRNKTVFEIKVDGKRLVPSRVKDFYTHAFMNAIDYTENCYSCHYATESRVGDLTLGDSWGTEIKNEEKEGISLALIQSKKGEELIHMTNLVLKSVDLEKAKIPNTQLRHPSVLKPEHDIFFKELRKGKSFKRAIITCYPKYGLKQELKLKLINAHIISDKKT